MIRDTTPSVFIHALTVTFFKQGDKAACGIFKGLSLICTAAKIVSKVLLNRLKIISKTVLPESQSGFRSKL